MALDRKPAPALIADAAESQAAQLRHREIRYVIISIMVFSAWGHDPVCGVRSGVRRSSR